MRKIISKLFGVLECSDTEDVGFYDITPIGFSHEVFIYLGSGVTASEAAVDSAVSFLDDLASIDLKCREIIENEYANVEDATVQEYFDFYKENVPAVFNTLDISSLTIKEMIDKLVIHQIGIHKDDEIEYVVDYTLGYDQLLCVKFDEKKEFENIAWES